MLVLFLKGKNFEFQLFFKGENISSLAAVVQVLPGDFGGSQTCAPKHAKIQVMEQLFFRGRFWQAPDNPLFFSGNLDSLVRA